MSALAPQLEQEAFTRITAAQDVASALGDLAIAARALPPQAAVRLHGAFVLLSECQAVLLSPEALPHEEHEASEQPQGTTDGNVERLVYLWRALQHLDAGQRVEIICVRTGWSKTKIYRLKAKAKEFSLL